MPTAAELRALADRMEEIETLGVAMRQARAAYAQNPSNADLKAAHRDASQRLADARREAREANQFSAED